MSSINKIRYINVNYNGTARVIPDLTFNFGGENSIMLMPNGGGKSVLVQMSIAALMSNPKLRNFKGQMHAADREGPKRNFDYFMTSPCPTVIMFEWNLESGSKFLSGSVFRKPVNDTSESGTANPVLWQGFACEYTDSCPVDIDSIPLIGGTKSKPVFLSRKEMTDILKSLASKYREDFGFRYYNLNDSSEKSRYFSRLEGAGIHQREWESIIRTINQEEGGAAAYFRNNAVERKLAASILVPTVVEKIDPSGSVIAGFRNAFAKYAANRMENEDVLEGAKNKREFLADLDGFRTVLEDYVGKSDGKSRCAAEAATLLRAAEDYAETNRNEMAAVSAQIEANSSLLAEARLKQISLEYYRAEAGLKKAEAGFEEIKAKADRISAELKTAKAKKGRLDVSRALDEYRTAQTVLNRIDGELEAIRGENKGDEAEIEQLRRCISACYTRDIAGLEQRRKVKSEEKDALASEIKTLEADRRKATAEVISGSRTLGTADVSRTAFRAAAEHFNAAFGTQYVPGADGLYSIDTDAEEKSFAERAADVAAELDKTEKAVQTAEKTRLEAQEQASQARAEVDRARYGKAAASERLAAMERARAVRTAVCSVYGVEDAAADEFDTAGITQMLQDAIRRKELLIREKEARLRSTEAERARIEGGQLSSVAADVAAELDRHGIGYIPGLRWLSDRELPEDELDRVLESNPLLPYSVVVSEENMGRLRKIRKLLPFMSEPLIVSVPDAGSETAAAKGGPVFIANFNRLLLKPGAIKDEAERLDGIAAADRDFITRREEEKRQLLADLCRISEDGLSASEYSSVKTEIAECERQENDGMKRCASAEEELSAAARELEELNAKRIECSGKLGTCRLACSTFEGLKSDYIRYRSEIAGTESARAEYDAAAGRAAECEEKIAVKTGLSEECRSEIGSIDSQIAELVRLRYPYWVSEEFPDNRIGKVLEKKIAGWENPGNAIGRYEVLTGKVKSRLEEACGRKDTAAAAAERKKAELEQLMRKNGVKPGDTAYLDPYTSAAYDRIETQIAEMEDELQNLHDREVDISGDRSRCRTVLAQIELTLKNCGSSEPLPEESIEEKDYAAVAAYLEKTADGLDSRLSDMEKTADRLETIAGTMGGYRLYDTSTLASQRLAAEYRKADDTDGIRRACIAAAEACKQADMLFSDASVMRAKEIERLTRIHSGRGLAKVVTKLDFDTRNAEDALKNLDGICSFLETMLRTEERAAESIRRDLTLTAESGVGYMESVSSELNRIGARSTILIGGERRKMVSVSAPVKDRADIGYEIEQYLSRRYTECLECRAKSKSGDYREAVDRITTESLYDEVFGFDKIRVTLVKIETGGFRQCSWSEAASQSGGENLFACLSLIFALISYLRSDGRDLLTERCERIPVPLDNIFGAMSSSHLIEPFFELARQNNIQLICYTGLTDKAIISPFSNIYKLELAKAGKKEVMYISEDEVERAVDNESEMVFGRLHITGEGETADD